MYNAPITRKNPLLLAVLIDRSGSMSQKVTVGAETLTKAEYVARVVNEFISELVNRCRREEGVRDYFRLGVAGYSGDGVNWLLGQRPVSPSELCVMGRPTRSYLQERVLPGGNSVLCTIDETLWIEPDASGGTPMLEAFEKTRAYLAGWCARPENAESYPPVVINISDGEASDGGREQLMHSAGAITGLSTSDGNVLLINIHITGEEAAPRVIFPCTPEELPVERNARLLYDMSSVMPAPYEQMVIEARNGRGGQAPFRGVSYNTPVTELVAMLNIGSLSVNLMI